MKVTKPNKSVYIFIGSLTLLIFMVGLSAYFVYTKNHSTQTEKDAKELANLDMKSDKYSYNSGRCSGKWGGNALFKVNEYDIDKKDTVKTTKSRGNL